MLTRKHVYYSGSVQGVGFRYTARRLAQSQGLAGFARNLPDGRVELAVEGEAGAVAAFLESVADAMGGYIRNVEILDEPPTGRDSGFGVARGEP
jgi:acylphosphatase